MWALFIMINKCYQCEQECNIHDDDDYYCYYDFLFLIFLLYYHDIIQIHCNIIYGKHIHTYIMSSMKVIYMQKKIYIYIHNVGHVPARREGWEVAEGGGAQTRGQEDLSVHIYTQL
jgi:hypothetical protein